MKKSVLTPDQRKRWMRMYTASINGEPVWKKDFEDWSEKYNKLMQEKLRILTKYSKVSEQE